MTPAIKKQIDALVDLVLGDRVDRHLLEPELRTALTVEVRDFLRYNPVEFADSRVKDHEILLRHPWFRPARKKAV